MDNRLVSFDTPYQGEHEGIRLSIIGANGHKVQFAWPSSRDNRHLIRLRWIDFCDCNYSGRLHTDGSADNRHLRCSTHLSHARQ